MKSTLVIRVLDGKIADFSKRSLDIESRRLKDGVYKLTIEQDFQKKSQDLMGYFWGCVLHIIELHTGMPKKSLWTECKEKFLGEPRVGLGGEIWFVPDGADINQEKLIYLVDRSIEWFAELFPEVVIPEADPNWRYLRKQSSEVGQVAAASQENDQ